MMKIIKYKLDNGSNDIELFPEIIMLYSTENYKIATIEAYENTLQICDISHEQAHLLGIFYIDNDVIEEPTQLDRIEAQITYTAMMTDTLLEV